MKSTIDKLYERLDALKSAHPDMIWRWHTVSGGYLVKGGVCIKCICPARYVYWDYDTATPHCALTSKYDIEDGVYTLIGATRKVTALERMDWTRFDDIAAKARSEQAEIQRRVDKFIEAATRPISDGEYAEICKRVAERHATDN